MVYTLLLDKQNYKFGTLANNYLSDVTVELDSVGWTVGKETQGVEFCLA